LPSTDDVYRECLHEIRFGVGITNPFAALFQYRVNLVIRQTPDDIRATKDAEKYRVAGIMLDAIIKSEAVSPGKLFGLR
jgi:hypothetical protein